MGLTIAAETIASNSTRATYTGADDLLAKFGLSRLYTFATTAPAVNPYQKLKQAGDRRLFKAERWSVASVVDWPEARNFHWREFSQAEVRRAFPLVASSFDLQDEERGVLVGNVAAPSNATPTASEGPSDVTGRIKIKIKTGAKRARATSQEPSTMTVSDQGGSQPSQAPTKKQRAAQ